MIHFQSSHLNTLVTGIGAVPALEQGSRRRHALASTDDARTLFGFGSTALEWRRQRATATPNNARQFLPNQGMKAGPRPTG